MTKNRKEIFGKHDLSKAYSLEDACNLVKDISTTKFDASIDMCIRLGVVTRGYKSEVKA